MLSEGLNIGGIAKLATGSVAMGLVLAEGAVAANPEMAEAITPDLKTSIATLAIAIASLALRRYMPSKQDFAGAIAELKTGHIELKEGHKELTSHQARMLGLWEEFTRKWDRDRDESREHRIQLAHWMGRTESKIESLTQGQVALTTGQADTNNRLHRIERGQRDSGEIKRS